MPIEKSHYEAAFKIISRDLERLIEFIDPTDDNLNVYSHRIFELQLRTCTEFESICKDILILKGYGGKPSDFNIYDYKRIEDWLMLEQWQVGVLFWHLPRLKYIRPFEHWSTANPPLHWYKSYNEVKHNRVSNFHLANFNNLLLSVGALFMILSLINVIKLLERETDNNYSIEQFQTNLFHLKIPLNTAQTYWAIDNGILIR